MPSAKATRTLQIFSETSEPPMSKQTVMHARSGKRITASISLQAREKLRVAADLVDATLNQFVVQAALEKADKVIESESAIVLTRRESLRLLEMIENPPPRNQAFLHAQARYQQRKSDTGSVA